MILTANCAIPNASPLVVSYRIAVAFIDLDESAFVSFDIQVCFGESTNTASMDRFKMARSSEVNKYVSVRLIRLRVLTCN